MNTFRDMAASDDALFVIKIDHQMVTYRYESILQNQHILHDPIHNRDIIRIPRNHIDLIF